MPAEHFLSLEDQSAEFNAAQAVTDKPHYVLCLYVVGVSEKSSRAIVNVRSLCEQYLLGRYELGIVDLLKNPQLAVTEQIVAAPTLIKKLPQPLRRFIGDMSDTDRLLGGLDLKGSKT